MAGHPAVVPMLAYEDGPAAVVYVDDLEAHFERAMAAGATILSAVETTENGKRYRTEDLAGHRWMFMQR